MDADDLTPEQCAKVSAKLRPMQHYPNRLRQRIERRHFPPDDPLRREVKAACGTMLRLTAICTTEAVQVRRGRGRIGGMKYSLRTLMILVTMVCFAFGVVMGIYYLRGGTPPAP